MESQIIQINGINFLVANKGGVINEVIHKPIPQELTPWLPLDIEEIIGRDNDLLVLDQLLQKTSKLVLVNGLGGIGKTTLAQAYVQQHLKKITHLAWINILHNTKEDFVFNTNLRDNLGIDLEQLNRDEHFVDKAFDLVSHQLNLLEGDNLLVLDNALSDLSEQQILNNISLGKNWKILVTSWQSLMGFLTYELGFLSLQDAIRLFQLHYNREKDVVLIEQIVQIVDRHTLAIEVIAKTAEANQLTLDTLIRQLRISGLKSLDKNTEAYIQFPRGYNERMKLVFTFLLEIFDLAALTLYEQWILMQLSILPPIFIAYQNNEGENIQSLLQIEIGNHRMIFADAIHSIVSKGWLLYNKKKKQFKLHQVLQEILRIKLTPNSEQCETMILAFTKLINYESPQAPFSKIRFLKYAESIINHLDLTDARVNNLVRDTANMHLFTGSFYKSENLIQKALLADISNPTNSLRRGQSYDTLAVIYQYMGDFQKALTAQKKAIAALETPPIHEESLALSYRNICILFSRLQQLEEALKYGKKSVQLLEELSSQKSKHHLVFIYTSLSRVYQHKRKLKKALKYQKKAITIGVQVLDPQHPDLLNSYSNLSTIFYMQGKRQKAISVGIEAIERSEEAYGEEHPILAIKYNDVSVPLREEGKILKALAFQQKAIAIQIKTGDPYHANLAVFYSNIAKTHKALKNYKEAKTYLEQSLFIFNKHYPAQHPYIQTTHQLMVEVEKMLS